jgi:ribose 5-phosphate isomerase B
MKVAIGSDQNGLNLKNIVKEYITFKGIEVVDFGVNDVEPVDYPDVALLVANKVAAGDFDRAILVCGTGIGMAIVANKVPGVRAAQCYDVYSAERARKSNNAQVMTLGAQITGSELAKKLVDVWLESEFQGGRSLPKVERINEIDKHFHKVC